MLSRRFPGRRRMAATALAADAALRTADKFHKVARLGRSELALHALDGCRQRQLRAIERTVCLLQLLNRFAAHARAPEADQVQSTRRDIELRGQQKGRHIEVDPRVPADHREPPDLGILVYYNAA